MTERLEYDGLLGVCREAATSSHATYWLRSFTDSDDRGPWLGYRDVAFEPRLRQHKSPFPGNVFLRARDKSPKKRPQRQLRFSETKRRHDNAANPGLFASRQEISAIGGLRGGPGRIRTSNQTVIARTMFAFEKPPKPTALAGDALRISPF